jgi:hypothetical protein
LPRLFSALKLSGGEKAAPADPVRRPLRPRKNLDGVDGPRSPASMCHNVVVGERHK